jgi:hypothetical protein
MLIANQLQAVIAQGRVIADQAQPDDPALGDPARLPGTRSRKRSDD